MTTRYHFSDLIESLREGRYTSIGSYPKYYYTVGGSVLSHEAVISNILEIGRAYRDKPDNHSIAGVDINYENHNLYCDGTGEKIDPAYPEDTQN